MQDNSIGTGVFLSVSVCALLYFIGKNTIIDRVYVSFSVAPDGTSSPEGAPSRAMAAMGFASGLDEAPAKPAKKERVKPVMTESEQKVDADRREYIARYADLAIQEMKKFRIPASITIAQGLLETAAGTSPLARNNNNHFGMKCFSKRCGKGHCTNATDDTHKDFFRKYTSAWASYRAHSQLLSDKYRPTNGVDYKAWAKRLQEKGYATNKRYEVELCRLIELYALDQYDQE
jgi:flagellum-specific peptidoglycan hydrolase FlgJ